MAVDIGNGSRVVVTVRGAGLKGDKGDTPGEYLKSVIRESSGRVLIEDDDGALFGISAIHASNAGEGAIALKITNMGGNVFHAVISGGEDYVFLNNPTFYVDADDGDDDVVITEQSDLNWAHAFQTFAGVKEFINRATIFGNITLRCRGVFAEGPGEIGPAQFKGAGKITIRGDNDTNPAAFEIPVGRGFDGARLGIKVTGGEVTIRDCLFRFYNANDTSTRSTAVLADAGEAILAGRIRFEGFYNRDRVGASSSYFGFVNNGAQLTIGANTRLIVATDTGAKIDQCFRALSGGGIIISGDVVMDIQSELDVNRFIYINSGASLRCTQSQENPNQWSFTGGSRIVAPYSVLLQNLATCEVTWPLTRAEFIDLHWGVISAPGVTAEAQVKDIATINGVINPEDP